MIKISGKIDPYELTAAVLSAPKQKKSQKPIDLNQEGTKQVHPSKGPIDLLKNFSFPRKNKTPGVTAQEFKEALANPWVERLLEAEITGKPYEAPGVEIDLVGMMEASWFLHKIGVLKGSKPSKSG